MSAKKKEKSEWSLCAACDCHFPRSVLSKHTKICAESEESFDVTNSSKDAYVDSGFINNGLLHGKIRCYELEQDGTVPSNKNDVILLNPKTIRVCNFQIACSVLMTFRGSKTYGTVWPSSSLPVDYICVKSSKRWSLGVTEDELVMIEKNDCFSVIANEVVLKPLSIEASEKFDFVAESLLHNLDDTIVCVGDMIESSYYAEKMTFQVATIGCDLTRTVDGLEAVISLKNNFEDLSLNDSHQTKDFVSSTPVKYESSNKNFVAEDFVCCVMFSQTILRKVSTPKNAEHLNEENNVKILDKVGGLVQQKKLLEELVTFPFKYPSFYQNCGIFSSSGIILHGPSGVGKTFLAHSFTKAMHNVQVSVINGPELTSKYFGETENKLRTIFNKSIAEAPSILIIDEFDAVCPMRTSSSNESEKRIVATLASLMDSVNSNIPFVVIAITNKLDAVDMSLRRPGRFDQEIEFAVPNASERLDILRKLLNECKHNLSDENFVELSEITHGYVGADLSALCKKAGMIAINKILASHIDQSIHELEDSFAVTMFNFKSALCKVGPSAMKELTVDIPKVYWSDVGGQITVKQKLKEAIEWPLKHPEVFKRLGISPPRGLLMYGPPGCSKTLMAKALATESGLNFISIKGPEIFNKYLGESERAIRDIFHKARLAAPSIVFFDEIDAIGVQRSGSVSGSGNVADRVLAQILTELDGVEALDGVIIIAATNRPDIIDSALLRPGRIDRLIYVPLPDVNTRKEIFEIQFRTIPVSSNVSIEMLIQLSNGYSGAEICSLCRESAMIALREDFACAEVKQHHFEAVLNQIKPAINAKMIKFYDDFVLKTTGTF